MDRRGLLAREAVAPIPEPVTGRRGGRTAPRAAGRHAVRRPRPAGARPFRPVRLRFLPRTTLAAALLALLSACTARSETPAADTTLRIGFGIGASARDSSVRNLTDLLYAESLLQRNWDGRQTPRLASAWRWEEDGHALRLQLKQGVVLHDGTPLTAALVRDILQPSAGRLELGFEQVTGISAPADATLLIRLTRPDLFLLNGLADRRIVRPDAPDIGTGPFRLVRRDGVVETRRFDRYHGGTPALAGVEIVTYDTTRSAWAAMMRGEVNAAQEVSRDSVEFLEGSSTIQTFRAVQPFYVPLVFNFRHAALRQAEVRQALVEALDRDAIIERTMRSRGRRADGPIWPAHWAYPASVPRRAYDPGRAAARLDRAGFPLAGSGQAGEFHRRFSIRCMVYNQDPLYERMALVVQQQLFEIGVDVEIDLVDMETFGRRAAAGDFDTFLMRTNAGRSMDFTYRFWRSGLPAGLLMQRSGYTGADAALEQLRASTSDDQIRSAVAALATRFHEDAPAAFIAWMEVTRAGDARFDVGSDTQPDPFQSIWQWRPAAARSGR